MNSLPLLAGKSGRTTSTFGICENTEMTSGEPWVLDCGNGSTALISIGFSPFPAEFTADNIPPEWVARRIKKRNDTTLHSQGYAMIAGKKALWSKSSGPLGGSDRHPAPRAR